MLPVRAEPVGAQPPDVLEQQGPRPDDAAQLHGPRVQVALVGGAELPARHRERRAGHPAGQQRHAPVVLRPPQRRIGHVAFRDLPGGPVGPQRGARRRVEFDGQGVLEAGSLQPESLPARPSTDLDDVKICHVGLLKLSAAEPSSRSTGRLVMQHDQRVGSCLLGSPADHLPGL